MRPVPGGSRCRPFGAKEHELNSMKPTVGRKVWFWLGKEPMAHRVGNCLDMHQPFDATITYVHPGGARVNLAVLDHVGTHFTTHRVLLQDPSEGGDAHGGNEETEGLATWMPYQVGQARAATPVAGDVPRWGGVPAMGSAQVRANIDGAIAINGPPSEGAREFQPRELQGEHVFQRAECVFYYCPNYLRGSNPCKDKCLSPRDGAVGSAEISPNTFVPTTTPMDLSSDKPLAGGSCSTDGPCESCQ